MSFGLLVSMGFASYSARPVDFSYCGNTPSAWVGDIAKGVSLKSALAEQIAHYDEHIPTNGKVLRGNTRCMNAALVGAWLSLFAGGIWAAVLVSTL